MSILSAVLHVLAVYRFFLLPGFILGSLALSGIARACGRRRLTVLGPGLVMILAMVNVFDGPQLNGAFLHRNGIDATATVTGVQDTGSEYNDQRVQRHTVAFRSPGGEAQLATFDDDDFNVYPAPGGDGISYPSPGEVFTVRYIPGAPSNFVIVTDDGSPYARRVGCADPLEQLEQARRAWEFDRTSARFAEAYAARIEAVLRQRCGADGAGPELERTLGELRVSRGPAAAPEPSPGQKPEAAPGWRAPPRAD